MAGSLVAGSTATQTMSGNVSASVAVGTALTTGDVVFIAGGSWDSVGLDGITGITDDVNAGAYTILVEQGLGAGAGGCFLAFKEMSTDGTPTVTLRVSDNGDASFCVFAVRGLTGDQAGTAVETTTGSTDTPATGAITTTATATLVSVMTFDGSTTTISAGSGWTQIAEDESTTFQPFQVQIKPAQASGNHTGTWTLGAARVTDCGIAAFEESGGGGETPDESDFMVACGQFTATGGMVGRVFA